MSTTYMLLDLPIVLSTQDPTWATMLNAAIERIDSHRHTTGEGHKIPSDGLDLTTDLTFQNNNATNLRSIRLTSQTATLGESSDNNCVYSVNGNLYFNNGSGVAVKLTNGTTLNTSTLTSNSYEITSISGTHTILPADTYIVLHVNTTAARQITLPSAAAVASGRYYLIKDITGSAGTNNITINSAGSDTIDGATSYVLSVNYGAVFLVSDGTSKWTAFKYVPKDWPNFGSLNLSTTGTLAAGNTSITGTLGVSSTTTLDGYTTLSTGRVSSWLKVHDGYIGFGNTLPTSGRIRLAQGASITTVAGDDKTIATSDGYGVTYGDVNSVVNIASGVTYPIRTVSTNYTLDDDDKCYIVLIDPSGGGAIDVTLPAARQGRLLHFKATASGPASISILRRGTEQINGASADFEDLILKANYSATFVCDGTNWWVLS